MSHLSCEGVCGIVLPIKLEKQDFCITSVRWELKETKRTDCSVYLQRDPQNYTAICLSLLVLMSVSVRWREGNLTDISVHCNSCEISVW